MSGDPRTKTQTDLFRENSPPKERSHAPYQVSSATSREAAETITKGPAFHGNRLACLNEIAKWNDRGGVTRKQIAERFFAGKMNYVTGPIDILINEEHLVYQDPARDRAGFIIHRKDGSIAPRKIDGSAVLLLTQKGKAVMARSA
jgi:hypothetical protein